MPISKLGEYWFPYFHITLPLHAIPSTKVANSSKVLLLLLEARKTKELGATRRPGLLVKRLHSYSMGTTGSTIGPLDGTPFQWLMGLLSKASPRGQWLQIRGPQWKTKYVQSYLFSINQSQVVLRQVSETSKDCLPRRNPIRDK